MAQKTMTYIVLILLLSAGFLLGGLFGGGFLTAFTVPADHKQIIGDMKIAFTIEDWSGPASTTPRCVKSETLKYGASETHAFSVFQFGKEYGYSTWLWEYDGEVMYYMQIWGPDDTGKSYDIQITRNYAPAFTVTYKGATIIQASRSSGVQEGSVYVFTQCLYAFSVTVA